MATFDFTSGTRPLDKVLRWNTLDDAASLLSALTGEAWTPRRILSDVLDGYRIPQGKTQPPTCLRCAPPRSTKFARYKWDAENGTPSNPFVYVCPAPYQTVALYPAQVDDLLKTGEAAISIAERPEDDYGRPGEYVFVEPLELGQKVGISSIGMNSADLQEFAARVVATISETGTTLEHVASTSALNEQYAQQEAEKKAAGRFTLQEAAEAICGTDERVEQMVVKLIAAAERGDLATYGPGERAKYQYSSRTRARSFYEEAYWDDLNAWLAAHEPRTSYRFPRPHAESAQPADPAMKPLARQRHQENEILRVIRDLGHNPVSLPKQTPGKAGVKSAVRALLPEFTGSVFDKAWDRLRRDGEIADA
ncbi:MULTISPECIES: hypothetical protein [unclassified Burkholderia]|uniref:hypothetical protein n=1 Tax=unclassified Burkholderia TaxID=2613784 RepID=UPI002AB1F8E6|nr:MULTISPECIES: hypothetical protein [unclassified Burkholderia]